MDSLALIKQQLNAGVCPEQMGKPRESENDARFARRLGFTLPDECWALLKFADGFVLQDRLWFGFVESIDRLILFQDHWLESGRFWPLSDDGCGNCFCVARDKSVVFFDTMESVQHSISVRANSIDEFILSLLRKSRSPASR